MINNIWNSANPSIYSDIVTLSANSDPNIANVGSLERPKWVNLNNNTLIHIFRILDEIWPILQIWSSLGIHCTRDASSLQVHASACLSGTLWWVHLWVRLSAASINASHSHSWMLFLKFQARTHECECLSGSLWTFFCGSATVSPYPLVLMSVSAFPPSALSLTIKAQWHILWHTH